MILRKSIIIVKRALDFTSCVLLVHKCTMGVVSTVYGHGEYSGTSLLRTPLGPQEVSWLEGCHHFGGFFCTHLYVARTMDSVLIKEVSLFRRSLIERFHCRNLHKWILKEKDTALYVRSSSPQIKGHCLSRNFLLFSSHTLSTSEERTTSLVGK